jgi:hypothetical protein
MAVTYSLEQLFLDQDPRLVNHTIAPVLAWVPRSGETHGRTPYTFRLTHQPLASGLETEVDLHLHWVEAALTARVPSVLQDADQMRSGATALHEDVPKLAAYGLAFVAISVLMKGLRVVRFNRFAAPDLITDATPGMLRGVEVAGRTRGGASALRVVRFGDDGKSGKHFQLLGRSDVAEAHLSLWCSARRVAIVSKVKP